MSPLVGPPVGPTGRRIVIVSSSDPCGLILDKIYFETGSAALGSGQAPILEATANMFRCFTETCTSFRVEVTGHASAAEGDPIELSRKRAEAVRRDLIRRKVSGAILSVRPLAATRPVDTMATEEALLKNQRVEYGLAMTGC